MSKSSKLKSLDNGKEYRESDNDDQSPSRENSYSSNGSSKSQAKVEYDHSKCKRNIDPESDLNKISELEKKISEQDEEYVKKMEDFNYSCIEELVTEMNRLQNTIIKQLEKNKNILEKKMKQIETLKDALRSEESDSTNKYSSLNVDSIIITNIKKYIKEIKTLKEDNENMESENKALRDEIKKLKKVLRTYKNECAEAEDELNDTKETLKKSEKEVKRLKKENETKDKAISTIKEKFDAMKKEVDMLTIENNKEELKRKDTEIENVK